MFYVKHYRGLDRRLADEGVGIGPPQAVLLQLLTHWSPDRDNILNPSNQTIQDYTGLSRRSVQRAFTCIRQSGILEDTGGGGRGGRDAIRWRVTPRLKRILRSFDEATR